METGQRFYRPFQIDVAVQHNDFHVLARAVHEDDPVLDLHRLDLATTTVVYENRVEGAWRDNPVFARWDVIDAIVRKEDQIANAFCVKPAGGTVANLPCDRIIIFGTDSEILNRAR